MGCTQQNKKQRDQKEKNLNLQNFPSICEPNKDIQIFTPKPIIESSIQNQDQQKLATELSYTRFSYEYIRKKKFGQRLYKVDKGKQSLERDHQSLKNTIQSESQIQWYYEPFYSEACRSQIQNSRIIIISFEAIQKD